MSNRTELHITLESQLVSALDAYAHRVGLGRDALITCALCHYLSAAHTMDNEEAMKKGYEEMAGINGEWAAWGLLPDTQCLAAYEAMLAESERNDHQTR